MFKKTSIKCPHCGEHVKYAEDLMFYVLPKEGISCPNCGKVAIEGRKVGWLGW